jgi:F-type H+-transporting ATPase subunit delta
MDSLIRVRYAKAFFQIAKEKNMLVQLKTDIETIFGVCNNSPEFMYFLNSPVIKSSKKAELLENIFKTSVNQDTLNFLLLITHNKRETEIPGICRNFLELTRKDQNIKTATLVTASEIMPTVTEKIKAIIEKELKARVELSTKVNPDMIGGIILRVDDKQYDASVATQLKKIKQQLLKS